MLNYKIVASDLDGTLLKDNKTISQENYRAIAEYTRLGGHFVPSSGRTLTEIPLLVRNIPGVRYVLFSDGAGIYDKQTGQMHTCNMSGGDSKRLLEILWSYDTLLTVRSGGKCYVDAARHNIEEYDTYRLSRAYRDFVFRFDYPKANYREFCLGLDDIEMICVFFRYDDEQQRCKAQLEALGIYTLMASEPYNLEIVSKDAGKGKGLLRLADMLGVDRSETIGVGDSTNDAQSIQMAGLGLAMGNAWPEVQKMADRTVCTNEEHMMAYLMRYLIRDASATRFLLIRHGQSEANNAGEFAGHLDYPLTQSGLEQAECTADYIASRYSVDCVYASDLRRAFVTGQIAAEKIGVEVKADLRLREIFAGDWQGRTFVQLQQMFADSYDVWLKDIGNARTQNGESVVQLQKRVVQCIKDIAEKHPGETVVIATHATPIRALQCCCEGKTLAQMKDVPWVSNASVTEVECCGGQMRMIEAGYDAHLGGLVSKFPNNV